MADNKAEIVKLIFDLSHRLRDRMKKNCNHGGFTLPQGMVIGTLHKHGQMKVSDLSRTIGLSNSTMSGILDRLEKLGAVERVRSQQDKRIVYVQLTQQFLLQHPIFARSPREEFNRLFTGILEGSTPQEQEKVREGLLILMDLIDRNAP